MNRVSLNVLAKMFVPKQAALRSSAVVMLLCASILSATAPVAFADESGTSFWLPGQFGSLAAVPGAPG
jgi:hypothetical protein